MPGTYTKATYVPAMAAANAVLGLGFHENVTITPMKLQPLLCLAYCGYLKAAGVPLFTEPFRTWQYGPVVESVHWKFQCFHANPVDRFASDAKGIVESLDTRRSPALRPVMADVRELYLGMDAVDLCELVRTDGTAWDYAWRHRLDVVPDDGIAKDPFFDK